ncbi:TIGR03086 family metal-binding protein [Yinghuangia sp. ASG 101]|uniref:TIGR03086 family metal-binding protein n=1 Tax=Yinghuangia sp. ASG 101 TaxID=2896848 RepID=UPI001E52BD2D|nr:TIGR03086 family metal-binding protein [Yinghuangia sp. ASG 101]UGQ13115.1 TIGR03086 family metal-binding protein [Yinghuangia sp. ASG 101]
MTTYPISDLLDAAARRALPVVRGVSDDRLGDPTPCRDYTVADLTNHLFQVVVNFQALAAKEAVTWPEAPDHLHGDWRAGLGTETERLSKAWAAPGSEEGVSPGMGLPSRAVGQMALLDLTVHAWDLARATGQDFDPAPEVLPDLEELVAMMGPTGRGMGVFGEPVDPAPDAGRFERLLASTGRDPGWTRPV